MTITSYKDTPCPPYSFICLDLHRKDENGNIFISLDMMTDSEVDVEVDKLIAELEQIRKNVKKELKKAYGR